MPKFTFTNEDVPKFTLLPKGKYQYEVIGYDLGISNGKKSNGCQTMELKIVFFIDDIKAAQWTETLIFPEAPEEKTNLYFRGKINMFVKSSGLLIDGKPPTPNQPIDFDAEMVIGLRGWAQVDQKPGMKNPQDLFNFVDEWLVNEPKLPKRITTPDAEPAAEENPFG